MEKKIEFRRAMRGFNKEDVNRFISEENVRFNRLEASYTKQLDEKDREIGELLGKLSLVNAAEEENKRLNEVINTLHADITALNCKLTEKELLIDGLNEAIESYNEKISALENAVSDLDNRKTVSAYSDRDLEIYKEKAERYDEIYDQVDEILAFAKEEAEKILKEAAQVKLEAEKAAKRESLSAKSSVKGRSDSIIDDLKKSIKKQLGGIIK